MWTWRMGNDAYRYRWEAVALGLSGTAYVLPHFASLTVDSLCCRVAAVPAGPAFACGRCGARHGGNLSFLEPRSHMIQEWALGWLALRLEAAEAEDLASTFAELVHNVSILMGDWTRTMRAFHGPRIQESYYDDALSSLIEQCWQDQRNILQARCDDLVSPLNAVLL